MKEIRRIILEGVIVLVAGAGVGLLANAVSPKGLSLTRNYFPTRTHARADSATPTTTTNKTNKTPVNVQDAATQDAPGQIDQQPPKDQSDHERSQAAGHDEPAQADAHDDSEIHEFVLSEQEQQAAAQVRAEGLEVISHREVVELYNDPAYEAGAYLFIDARNATQFQEGHIPGAVLMDHYYIDKYIDAVFPLCQGAIQVVVYCGGGDCEDSLFAGIELRNRGIDPSKIQVYVGGMKQWKADQQPVEVGDRHSGNIK